MTDSRRQHTRNRILNAAEELIRRFSYPGLRLNKLSDALGMSRKTLYNHFPGGKREIWRRCIERRAEAFAERLFAVVADTEEDFVERARIILDIGREAMAHFHGPDGLIPSSADEQFFFPNLRRRYVRALAGFFEEGVHRGYLRKGLPIWSLSAALMTLIADWGRDDSLLRDGESTDLPDFAESVLFDGILSDEGRRNVARLHRGGTP